MKRVISYPPVVILLDILFTFLFVLILSASKTTVQITIPQDKLFDKAKILLIEKNGCQEYRNGVLTSFTLESKFNKFLACENQQECVEAKNRFGQDKEFVILLPQNLFKDISQVGMIAFGEKTCKTLHFNIEQNGSLDKKRLLQDNECLEKISGFRENF